MKKNILELLEPLIDVEYRKFHSLLIPDADKNYILGIRVPLLRKLAKALTVADFKEYDFKFQEEKLLYAFVISETKDYDECIVLTDNFLKHIDNWAICDSFRPKCFKNNKEHLILKIFEWLKSPHPYTVRFAIEMLMVHYLDEDFKEEYLTIVSKIRSGEYYVNMMLAWYFATAFAKKFKYVLPYFTNHSLDAWVHNKAIQKAIESYRVTDEQKQYLKTLKRVI